MMAEEPTFEEQLQALREEHGEQLQALREIIDGQLAEAQRMHEAEKRRADELQAVLLQRNEPEPEPTEEEKMDQLRPHLRNPVRLPDGRIDCVWDHPRHGPIPFTADPNDVVEHGRLIHRILAAG